MNSHLCLVSVAGLLLLLPATLLVAGHSSSSVMLISSGPSTGNREVLVAGAPPVAGGVAGGAGGAGCEIQKCGFVIDPVCGSDGRSHGSECHMRNRACRYGQTITLVHKGNCKRRGVAMRKPPSTGCQNVKCMPGAKCREVDGRAKCYCSQSGASTTLAAICASDGNTYGSIDDLHYSNCENRMANEKVHDSACK